MYVFAKFGFERCTQQQSKTVTISNGEGALFMVKHKCNGNLPLHSYHTYLEHFADTLRRGRTILGDIRTEDLMGIRVLLTVFVGLIVSELLENRL